MKATKHNTPRSKRPSSKPQLPEIPLLAVDLGELPLISHHEMVRYADALYRLQMAKADFERKRGELLYKLVLGCESDRKSPLSVHLDAEGKIVCADADLPLARRVTIS